MATLEQVKLFRTKQKLVFAQMPKVVFSAADFEAYLRKNWAYFLVNTWEGSINPPLPGIDFKLNKIRRIGVSLQHFINNYTLTGWKCSIIIPNSGLNRDSPSAFNLCNIFDNLDSIKILSRPHKFVDQTNQYFQSNLYYLWLDENIWTGLSQAKMITFLQSGRI